ncbi:MAG: TIGR04002 family protein [Ruminococcus sp.]|nr:TIGR04002 family protein [Ruminococcus sp.]MDE6784850.1 TIGR04002 family protein [Ruminococcus sp.]
MAETKSLSMQKMRRITATGMFAALIYVFTAYLHIPTGAGYTHAGDGLIFLAACILPTPYAAAAGAVGGALADGLSGFPIWIPATIIIKAVTSLFFSNKSEKIITLRNILGIIPSLILCAGGYSLYEGTVMAGGISAAAITAAFSQVPAYCIQIFASTLLFVSVGLLLDRIGFKKIMNK